MLVVYNNRRQVLYLVITAVYGGAIYWRIINDRRKTHLH